MADDENDMDIRLDVVQSMIDIYADTLEGLRTQCATSAEITQQEIRTLEGKLIKLFSKLVAETKLREHSLQAELKQAPSLIQWLKVVGLSEDSIQAVSQKVASLEALQDKSEHELKTILSERNAREEEVRRLFRALHNLRRYTEVLLQGDIKEPSELYWDSWDRHHLLKSTSPRPHRNRSARTSVPSEEVFNGNSKEAHDTISLHNNCISNLPSVSRETLSNSYQSLKSITSESSFVSSYSKSYKSDTGNLLQNFYRNAHCNNTGSVGNTNKLSNDSSCGSDRHIVLTPSESVSSIQTQISPSEEDPTLSPPLKNKVLNDRPRFPTTPPPRRKHQTQLQTNPTLVPEVFPLTKSKSHESQLAKRVDKDGKPCSDADNTKENNTENKVAGAVGRSRLNTEPGGYDGYTTPILASPIKSPPSSNTENDDSFKGSSNLQVPRSPRTPTVTRVMGHVIAHRFTKTFKMMSTCHLCEKQMFIGTGLKCKECKYRCHKDCEMRVPPSCGLPQEMLDEFKKHVQQTESVYLPGSSPSTGRSLTSSPGHFLASTLHGRERQRSHPQPAVCAPPFQGPDSSSNTSSCNSSAPSSPALHAQHTPQTPHHISKIQQFHFPEVPHEKGVTLETHPLRSTLTELVETRHSNTDSDKTVSLSGSNSTDSERTPIRVDSVDGESSTSESRWPRQNSLSMREWDIPFDELHMLEAIGTGRFGTVHRGNWHGDVAIKVLAMDYLDGEKTLEAFRLEVATFRKTRHDNLVLFMGACMKPPRLAIVTSLCKGMTLYTHIHLRKDKFTMNKTTLVAQQISQGMGYLHARGIVHKDLKSKNIFLENSRVVISDFGLFSVTKLCFGNRKGDSIGIPAGWLCYLAPEVIRNLRAHQKCDEEELPFSKASDVYAFGTVWYELLCGEWPFKGQPPESVIWQVGRGMKQTLANLQASRDVKDILMLCWSYRSENRPDFGRLLNTLEKLPKKRLARSPSHPVHLSRSAESVF